MEKLSLRAHFDGRQILLDEPFEIKRQWLASRIVGSDLAFWVVLPKAKIAGSIGSIPPERRERLLKRLSEYLIQ